MNPFTDPAGPAMRPAGSAALAALFDGQCGVCTRAAAWVRERDPGGRVERLDLRQAAAAARFPRISATAAREQLHVVDPSGRVWIGIDGLGRLLREIPGWRWLGRAIGAPGLRGVAGVAYRAFARRRLFFNRWFPLAEQGCDGTCTHAPDEAKPAAAAFTAPKFADARKHLPLRPGEGRGSPPESTRSE
jgi:predicted DCC family thiol-disulfide oxidoreductase YuxK